MRQYELQPGKRFNFKKYFAHWVIIDFWIQINTMSWVLYEFERLLLGLEKSKFILIFMRNIQSWRTKTDDDEKF